MNEFNAKEIKDRLVNWIRNWFNENGKYCKAVIGISGGVDSSVAAALCVEALGKKRVLGVLLPNGIQRDICFSDMLCDQLGIQKVELNIKDSVKDLELQLDMQGIDETIQAKINLQPRIRMSALYLVSQCKNGRVVNTSNLSESWIGWDTRYGDSVGDVSPLFNLTKTEIKLIGKELGLPDILVNKTPIDGLCGRTDEDKFGFTYDVLDKYIRTGVCEDKDIKEKIDTMHKNNLFKLQSMPSFQL